MVSKKTPLIETLLNDNLTMMTEAKLRRKTIAELQEMIDEAQALVQEAIEAAEQTVSIWKRIWLRIKALFS